MRKAKRRRPGRTEREVMAQAFEALACFSWLVEVKRQNTGAAWNARGQLVCFGEPGDSDITGMFIAGAWRGKKLDLEVKREGFDPDRVRGAERVRFAQQLDRLRRTNDQGGVGLWIDDAVTLFRVLPLLAQGARVELDAAGFPWIVDGE